MKPLLLSISSSEPDHLEAAPADERGRTLVGIPWPTPAAIIGLATFLAVGVALGHVGGRWHGDPPARVAAQGPERAWAYNARNVPRRADVVFLGNSLMLQGIIPSELADAIGVDRGDVKNLAMHGALPWDLAWLVDRMEEPKADGPRIAAINVDRAWFLSDNLPRSAYSRYREYQDHLTRGPVPIGERFDALLTYAVPERRDARAWFHLIVYGWLCYRAPGVVRAPPINDSPRIWDLDPEAQQRAAAGADAAARKARSSDEFAESSVTALRAVIGHLKTRSYRVVLLLTPLRRDRLNAVETAPLSKERDRRVRQVVLSPPYLGADAVVEFLDARALGFASDDSIFIDYGHLNRAGARAQTRNFAEALIRLGLVGKASTNHTGFGGAGPRTP